MLTAKTYNQVVLVILDGFGVASASRGNAITLAGTPNLDLLVSNYPSATLQAAGPLVGLPFGEPGNSEVGHLNIGAGRIVGQDLPRISKSIENRSFFQNPELVAACKYAKDNNSSLHLVGLVSQGGIHSLDEHLFALLGLAAFYGVRSVFIHMFTDGRDAPPKAALGELSKIELRTTQIGIGKVASVTGRFYAMDRGGHWQQTLATLEALILGKGEKEISPADAIAKNYAKQITDEMIPPTVITNSFGQPLGQIKTKDAVILFNFRPDRMAQLTTCLTKTARNPLNGKIVLPEDLYIVTMTEYASELPVRIAFPPLVVKNTLAEIISANHLKQLHMAESEKYAHVTTFFNCSAAAPPMAGEERIIIQSPKDNSRNYSDTPAMSADQLTDSLIKDIGSDSINFFVVNYANADMVGHTGNLASAIQSIKTLDSCLGKLSQFCIEKDAALIITADHGNIEQMIDPKTGLADTDHTANPVPIIFVANEWKFTKIKNHSIAHMAAMVPIGAISDIAPTVLHLLGLPVPKEMLAVDLLSML